MRTLFLSLLLLVCATSLAAQSLCFSPEFFQDTTLRLDYTLTGGQDRATGISLDKLARTPGWYGRRQHLDSLNLIGNGQIEMRDAESRQVLYRTSFSTLFQEWLAETNEPQQVNRSFQLCQLVPMPRQKAEVTVSLLNMRHEPIATFTHTVDPSDILIHRSGEQPLPYVRITADSIIRNTADVIETIANCQGQCIPVAFLPEGYTADEMERFYEDCRVAVESLLGHEPYATYAESFRFFAVNVPSTDSGVSIPLQNDWRRTAFGSHFSTFYSDRYLTTLQVQSLHDALAGIPYQHIIVLANTDNYGGGGIFNMYNLTAAHHPKFRPVVVHEFGHSFAGLADEYFYEYEDVGAGSYPLDVEPWEPNITTRADQEKGERIGRYEGGGYASHGIYRYQEDCRMRTNEYPTFCPVCLQAIIDVIRFYTR